MRIVVTGASGFIGRALMTSLRAAGHEAVTDLRGAHALVHLAAIAHRRGVAESELRRVNFGMAVDTGRSAAVAGVPMIFMGSVKVRRSVPRRLPDRAARRLRALEGRG
jgi:nucleoside-diphosphate-sugar epimerase